MEKLKITLSFKPSEKWLYDIVMSHAARSGWVKDILKEHIKDEKKESSVINPIFLD